MQIAERVIDEDPLLFWLILAVPGLAIYYMITRWHDVKGPLLVAVAGYAVTIGSMILVLRTVY